MRPVMDFQWFNVRGEIPCDPEIASDTLMQHVAACLRQVSANNVVPSGDTIAFTAGVFRWVTSMNPLVSFDKGTLVYDSQRHTLAYRIRFYQVVVSTLIAGLGSAVFLIQFDADPAVVVFGSAPSLWVLGGNMIFGTLRFRNYLIRTVGTAPRKVKS